MWSKIKGNLANMITAIRLVVAVHILILYFSHSDNWIWRCSALFVFGSVTDMFDGLVARKLGSVSNWGKLFDPVCDKLMLMSMLLVLTLGKYIYKWVFIALAAKELLMMTGAVFLLNKKIVVKSNWFGKLSTFLLTVAVVLSVFRLQPYSDYFFIAAVTWTILTMVQYGVLYFKQLKETKKEAL